MTWFNRFIRSWLLWAGIITGIMSYVGFQMHEYGHYKDRNCIVLDKLQSSGRYSGNFYLVMEEDRGIVFDRNVRPSTYSQAEVGQNIVLRLRDMDIKQTKSGNALNFLLIILGSAAISFLLVSAFVSLLELDNE